MSAVVKGTIRLKGLYSKDPIVTSRRMFEVATKELTTSKLEFIYVTREEVDNTRQILEPRYRELTTIPGTRGFHFLAVEPGKKLLTKRYANSTNHHTYDVLKIQNDDIEEAMDIDETENTAIEPPIIGEFYAIKFAKTYLIGRAIQVFSDRQTANFMIMKKAGMGGHALTWPETEKVHESEFDMILVRVSPPYYKEKTKNYRLKDEDLALIKSAQTG